VAIAGLSARLYFDHHVPHRLAREVRRHRFDVVVAAEIGMDRASDPQHFARAVVEGRALVTFDVKDYLPLAARWAEEDRHHSGLIVSKAEATLSVGVLLRGPLAFLDRMSADDLIDQVRWLDASLDE